MAKHNQLGQLGEEMAVNHIQDKGYYIVARNYRYRKAEIDIIARKDDVLVVIEVKTRSTTDFGNPQDFVKRGQIKRLVEAVDNYIAEHELSLEVRFDIIAIIVGRGKYFQIEHLENAFYHF
jgi:putative endonuclease